VIEPTGPAWLPIAVFFSARGHTVYRVSSAKAADLRRFLRRHAKSNGIDAETLARLPLVDPAGLRPLELPDAPRAALDRRVRACDRLTQAAATHKRRLKDLVRQLLPASPLAGELGQADLAVLERWADPHALVTVGGARLARVIAQASNGQQGARRAEQWLTAAKAALELYAGHPAIAFTELAAEVTTEVRLLRATQAELAAHATKREACYQQVDPAALARSLPGLATVGGPALVATMGPAGRFRRSAKFRSFTGLAPRRRRPARATARANPSPRPATGCCAPPWSAPPTTPAAKTPSWPASTGSRWSSAARTTWGDLRGRRPPGRAGLGGHEPRPALCHLRYRRHPGHPAQAKVIIAERWIVPEQVRRRRRSRKGKAPQQVHAGHVQGAQGATRRPSPPPASLGRRPRGVKQALPPN
jgi:transposase